MLLGFDDYALQSRRLGQALGMPCHIIKRHRFPDGESKLTLPPDLPGHVIFCRSLDHPNEKLMELLLAAKTARQLGAKVLTLVAPYLCYMRQDKAFHNGEAVSQTIVGEFLADLFDNVITVDPHLHRILQLEQAVPASRAISLSATGLMSNFLREQLHGPLLLGPDNESQQWVSAVARPGRWDFGVCKKIRKGDQDVDITLPAINFERRDVVLVDDIASSGQTLLVATKKCLEKKARRVDILVTHALFTDGADQRLIELGAGNIWSTDSVCHESNVIPLHGLLKQAVLDML